MNFNQISKKYKICIKNKKKLLTITKIIVYIEAPIERTVTSWPVGRVAHAEDCKSLYIGSIPVPASKSFFTVFRLSSAVEQSAVNRLVACSNQAAGANKKTPAIWWVFFLLISAVLLRTGDCLFVSGLRIKTTPTLVVFTAKGVALSVCEPACATRNKPYKASDRHAVCECIARTYQARAGASFFFTHRLVGVFLLISAVFLRTATACSYQA